MTLKVTALTRQHPGNERPTLAELSCELPAGSLTAVVGKSGVGKSTLLRCVVGLEPFERGEVQVEDVVVRGTAQCTAPERAQAMARARARLGFVFQSFELFPHLTALQNCVLAPVRVKGEARDAAAARARGLLDQLGLGDKLEAWPEQLSGGQQQRVAIARALAMEPRVLLYDEPTSALDPSMKHEVLQTLRSVQRSGVTQVVVTHQLAVARGADYVCVIDQGRIVEAGPPAQVLEAPQHESTRALLSAWAAGGE